jgi:hypothetical protein
MALAVFRPEASGKVLPLSTFIGWLRISGMGRVRISGTHDDLALRQFQAANKVTT